MLNFIGNQIVFYLTLGFLLFLPGYFFFLAVFGNSKKFSSMEKFVVSFGLSIINVDFIMLFLGRLLHVSLTRVSLIVSVLVFSLICYAIFRYHKKKNAVEDVSVNRDFNFSSRQTILIVLIIFLAIFIRVGYLRNAILPATTDLGHHMYWAKVIATSGKIPNYAQRNIIEVNGTYVMSQPQNISDFIIGEHLIFAATGLITGLNFTSYFPVTILFIVDVMSLLALFILALRFFENHPQGKNIAIISLLLIGPLFALAPPQAKYVGGGVVGNVIGDLLVPLIFYFFYRSLKEKDLRHLFLTLFLAMGIFYTHHLSGFVFLLSLVIIIPLILLMHIKELGSFMKSWSRMIFSPLILSFFAFVAFFMFFVYTPTYLTNNAVDTVVGAANKVDHVGLTFSQFKFAVGEPRDILGIVGILFFFLFVFQIYKKKSYQFALLLGWIFIVGLVTIKPEWVFINLPSDRFGNYGTYPLSIVAAFAFVELIFFAKNRQRENNFFLSRSFLFPAGILLLAFVVISGFYDNAQNSVSDTSAVASIQLAVQTRQAAQFLSDKVKSTDNVVFDHVYVTSDTWIKLFFMRGYNFPLYRADLFRYTDGVDKQETCTLDMISDPDSVHGQKCFNDLGVDYVLIDQRMDSAQFDKSDNFWKIYSNGEIAIYYRPASNAMHSIADWPVGSQTNEP